MLVVRHFDFYAQALAKLERGIGADATDVAEMVDAGLVDRARLRRLFDEIEEQLYRFPAVDARGLRDAVERFAAGSTGAID